MKGMKINNCPLGEMDFWLIQILNPCDLTNLPKVPKFQWESILVQFKPYHVPQLSCLNGNINNEVIPFMISARTNPNILKGSKINHTSGYRSNRIKAIGQQITNNNAHKTMFKNNFIFT